MFYSCLVHSFKLKKYTYFKKWQKNNGDVTHVLNYLTWKEENVYEKCAIYLCLCVSNFLDQQSIYPKKKIAYWMKELLNIN